MLEFEDIQHILLTRTPALTGRYVFLKFGNAEVRTGVASRDSGTVRSAAAVDTSENKSSWVTVAFTWNGLRALGVDEERCPAFPMNSGQGMAARAEVLGDTGPNAPEHWVDGTNRPDLHAIAILFARDAARAGPLRGGA